MKNITPRSKYDLDIIRTMIPIRKRFNIEPDAILPYFGKKPPLDKFPRRLYIGKNVNEKNEVEKSMVEYLIKNNLWDFVYAMRVV